MASMVLRVVLGALILTGIQIAGGLLQQFVGLTMPQPPSNPLPWLFVDNVLIVAVLSWVARRSAARGWRLALTLGLLLFGIATFNSLIEAQFFGFFGTRFTLALMTATLVEVALFAPLLVLVLRPALGESVGDERPQAWHARLSLFRLFLGGIVYVVTYFAAGLVVFPYIRDFYATMPTPNPLTLVAFQTLFRGPIFVALLYAALRTLRTARTDAIIIAGALLSVIGGIGLIVPNGFFPDYVRWSHFFEVTISNFAFGAFVGWLLTRPARADERRSATAGDWAHGAR